MKKEILIDLLAIIIMITAFILQLCEYYHITIALLWSVILIKNLKR